ncbi:MAG: hypothetical protein M5U01_22785 [Ardenticatenaceae bacterium]|nr:hypothetical protein [Ardenticatenaceae bacterium]HBY93029.1 hypothetical protein [Chloroflexota bacterium]
MKTGMLKERRSGDTVEVGYDTFRRMFWINGRCAERMLSLERKEGVWVFELWLAETESYEQYHFSVTELQTLARS